MNRDQDFFLQFGETGTSFWTGVVEDRDDPALMGRVRVRIFGIHPMDRTEVPTDTLPWATVILPTTESAISGIGSAAPAMVEGTWVVGFFRDGISCQDPIVFGCVLTNSAPKWTGPSNLPSPEDLQIMNNSYKNKTNKIQVYEESLEKFFDQFSHPQFGALPDSIAALENALNDLGINSIDDLIQRYPAIARSAELVEADDSSDTPNEISLMVEYILNAIYPKLNEAAINAFSLQEAFSDEILNSLFPGAFRSSLVGIIIDILERENIEDYTLDDFVNEVANYSINEIYSIFRLLGDKFFYFTPPLDFEFFDDDGNLIIDFPNLFADILFDAITNITEALSSFLDEFFDNLPITSIFDSIFGIIGAPFAAFGDILNDFWDAFTVFVNQGLLEKLFFFDNFDDIIPEPVGFSFGDIRRGVQPGTILERPNPKYPLLPSESDIHRVGRGDQTVFQPGGMKYKYDMDRDPLFNEPEMDYDAIYPYNHYKETESGHIFEYDDTPSKERIQERHKSGTGYHINPDGSKKEIVKGENFVIYVNNNKVHVQGRMELYVDKDVDLSINGQADISIAEDANIRVGNNANIDVSKNTNIKTKYDTEIHSRNMLIRVEQDLKLESQKGSISIRSEKNMLLSSHAENIGILARKGIELGASENIDILARRKIELSGENIDVLSKQKTVVSGQSLNLVGPDRIDINTDTGVKIGKTPRTPTSVKEPDVPKPVKMHQDLDIPEKRFFERYEDIGADGADRWIEQEDIKLGMETGAFTLNEWAHRKPDIVLPKEVDETDPVDYSPTSKSKYSIEWLETFFAKYSNISTSNPNHPIYKLKISPNIYVGDLTIWCLFKHYIPPDPKLIYNLSHLANTCVDPLYGKYGGLFHNKMNRPKGNLLITCGYRRTGSRNHTNANAFDFQLPHIGKGYYYDEALYIKNNIGSIDKLLLEYKTSGTKLPWIHLQSAPNSARGIICTYMDHVKHSDGLVNLAHKNRL